jgi:hypothetical protein
VSMKRCASENGSSHTTPYACPVDGRSCVVLEPLRERMVSELGREGADKLAEDAKKYGLPCGSCRKGEQDAGGLSGVRLGRHERRILLFAPPGSKCGWRDGQGKPTFPGDGAIVYPEGPSRAAEEANRRALRKLERAGLVDLSRNWSWAEDDKPPDWFRAKKARSRYWVMGRAYRTARLTPLGESVVERCRHELETGKPIRWQKLLNGLVEDVVRPQSKLFEEFGLWLGGTIFFSAFGSTFARTEEARNQAKKRSEAAKRLQAFVSEKAARS